MASMAFDTVSSSMTMWLRAGLRGVADRAVVTKFIELADVVEDSNRHQQVGIQLRVVRRNLLGLMQSPTTCSSRPPR
jgi:hypothetical protein